MPWLSRFYASTWDGSFTSIGGSSFNRDPYEWNYNLAMAAQHVANEEGPCGTLGDRNSAYVEDVLSRYYAYSYDDIQVLRVESTEFVDEDNGYWSTGPAFFNPMAWILSQECIDRSIFFNEGSNIEMGIGCACSSSPSEFGNEDPNYICYFVTARNVVNKEVVERIPGHQTTRDTTTECWYNCDILDENDMMSWYYTDQSDCPGSEDDAVIDGYCHSCDEVNYGCVDCDSNGGCNICEVGEGEEHEGHQFNPIISWRQNQCTMLDCVSLWTSDTDAFDDWDDCIFDYDGTDCYDTMQDNAEPLFCEQCPNMNILTSWSNILYDTWPGSFTPVAHYINPRRTMGCVADCGEASDNIWENPDPIFDSN